MSFNTLLVVYILMVMTASERGRVLVRIPFVLCKIEIPNNNLVFFLFLSFLFLRIYLPGGSAVGRVDFLRQIE